MPPPLIPARPGPLVPAHLHPTSRHTPRPGTPPPHWPGTPPPHRPGTMGPRPKFRHASASHPGPPQVPACLRPTSGTPLPHRPGSPLPHLPGTLPPHRTGTPPPLIPARPRAPDPTRLRPSARSASAPQPASRSNCKSYHPIPAGIIRGEDSTRTRTETLAAFPGINCVFPWCEQPHMLVQTSLNNCMHSAERHSSTLIAALLLEDQVGFESQGQPLN
jgi:hypothetical protein